MSTRDYLAARLRQRLNLNFFDEVSSQNIDSADPTLRERTSIRLMASSGTATFSNADV